MKCPEEYVFDAMRWLWQGLLGYPENHIPRIEPPLTRPMNPFERKPVEKTSTEILAELKAEAKEASVIQKIVQSAAASDKTRRKRKPRLRDVRASDYVTPQKYLDGSAPIPTWYSFQSNFIPAEDQIHGMLPATEVDRRLTVPTRTHIRFLVTATDVLHAWSVPSLHIKLDALPGRVSRYNTFILREGVFYGQCAEMCGALHSYMPIVIEAVAPETYAAHAKKFYRD